MGRLPHVGALVLLLCAPRIAHSQGTVLRDSLRCDSVVATARVDSVNAGLFVTVARADGGDLSQDQTNLMTNVIGGGFVPPRPFRLAVFSGPARMRLLRPLYSDTATELRAPTVTGVYRFVAGKSGVVARVVTVRASLMVGFDSASMRAIQDAGHIAKLVIPPNGEDSMYVEVRFATDSALGARRLSEARFPRLPVVDAAPRRDNPAAEFPEDMKRDGVTVGEVVLRFVVDREGLPALETIEVLRATSVSFLRSAVKALPQQRFAPATVHGCAVAQVVEYPFSFVAHEPPMLRNER
ncbi:MAG TPA: energy transducer TonB [Gemmatimonadaceae bacterium]|nr:energy transducer TonB [Gemmatimonadaceae bacterium]